jgi:hypothetical protein
MVEFDEPELDDDPIDDEPLDGDELIDDDEPAEGVPPLAPLDDPLRPPLLPAPLEPMLPVLPALLVPPTAPLLEPVAGLALCDELPDRLPDEPLLLLFRLLDLSSLPMPLPLCLLASTPFPSLDF